MTEVNKNFHFYIRVSTKFLFLSGIWCVNNVVLRAIIRSGLLLVNIKAEILTHILLTNILLFMFYSTVSHSNFRYHAKWKNCLGLPIKKFIFSFYIMES